MEKILNGIDHCRKSNGVSEICMSCPYNGNGCIRQLMNDTFELVIEQQIEMELSKETYISPLAMELYIKRHGLSTETDKEMLKQIEREIILEGLRLQQQCADW